MRKVILVLLMMLLPAGYSGTSAMPSYNETHTLPQYVLDQAPFLGGKYVIYLSWRTGNISDSQNLEKYLLENFAIYLNHSGVPRELIPEILANISITYDAKLTERNFDPDKDKFRANIFYNRLRLTELDNDTYILTLPWLDIKKINLSSFKNTKAVELIPSKDMSNLISKDNASEYVINALNSGYSLVLQNGIWDVEIRNAAVLVYGNATFNKSSGLRYMVWGSNELDVGYALWQISEAGGAGGASSAPVSPIPELSTAVLITAGLIETLIISRRYRRN